MEYGDATIIGLMQPFGPDRKGSSDLHCVHPLLPCKILIGSDVAVSSPDTYAQRELDWLTEIREGRV